jgi:hypothetical protein
VLAVPSRDDRLGTPWPLPARRSVSIPVLFTGGPARLTIQDASGRRVRELDMASTRTSGPAVWDLRDQHGDAVPSGIYFARLTIDGQPGGTRRLVVLR